MTQTHIPPPQIPKGWYPDPEGKPGERFWDGSGWTEQRRQGFSSGPPPPPPPPLPPPSPEAARDGSQLFYVERRSNGLAVAALVTGLVGLVVGLIPILFFIAWAGGITAIVLGIVARRRATRQPEVGRKRMATWAIVLGVLSIGIGIAGYAILNDAFTDLEHDLIGGTDEPKSSSNSTPAADDKPTPKPIKLTARAPHDVQTPTALVTGVVSPADATVSIKDARRERNVRVRNGQFRVRAVLDSGAGFTGVTVTATTPEDSTDQVLSINRQLTPEQLAEQRRKEAERQAAQRAAAEARAQQKQQDFINSAETIPYNQLIKDPRAFRGKKVVYTGHIFQIQQAGGAGIMLVSVTNEGYDIWDDNVWIDYFGNVAGAEGDQITVYGVMKGSKSYETQIGGTTYVPRIKAVYISEGGVIKAAN